MRYLLLLHFLFIFFSIKLSVFASESKMNFKDYRDFLRDYQILALHNIDAAKKSVVLINNYSSLDNSSNIPFTSIYTDYQNKEYLKLSNLGSGVVLGSNPSYIVTNYHVVKDNKNLVLVTHDGKKIDSKIKGFDELSDLAFLEFDCDSLKPIKVRSDGLVNVGETVYAIGSPYGLSQSVTSGIVSATGRTDLGISSIDNFIQTDASINKGNSGGALIDVNGELVGINTAIIGKDGNLGIGFAIPANLVMNYFNQIANYGNIKRSNLGVVVSNLSSKNKLDYGFDKDFGVLVLSVQKNSAADISGIVSGDIILKVNSHQVVSSGFLSSVISSLRENSTIALDVFRSGRIVQIKADLKKK